jgi:hypothetical protein
MGDSEGQLIVSTLGPQIKQVSDALEASRKERFDQIESIRGEVQTLGATLHKRVTDVDNRLRCLEISHATNVSKCGGAMWLSQLGEIKLGKKHISGLVAVLAVIAVMLCVLKWGPELVKVAMRPAAVVEHTKGG